MSVEVVLEDARWQQAGLDALANRACDAVLAHFQMDPQGHEISMLGCDETRIANLNRQFRGKDGPTNVLSWPAEGDFPSQLAGMQGEPKELGDIAIAWETCDREAREQGKRFDDHVTHLLVHACLHLLGYDHIDPTEAAEMEALEVEILGRLGIPDPYIYKGEEHGL